MPEGHSFFCAWRKRVTRLFSAQSGITATPPALIGQNVHALGLATISQRQGDARAGKPRRKDPPKLAVDRVVQRLAFKHPVELSGVGHRVAEKLHDHVHGGNLLELIAPGPPSTSP